MKIMLHSFYKSIFNKYVLTLWIIVSLFSFMSCNNNGTEEPFFEFNMGIVLPGPDVETTAEGLLWGKPARISVLMAIDEMNATEGVSITKIESYNGKDPQRALSNVKALIDNDDVNGIIGAGTSNHSTAIVNDGVLVDKKTLMISPTNTSPSLTAENDYFYRTTPSDTLMAKKFAELIVTTDTAKSLVIIYRSDDNYAQNLYTFLKQEANTLYANTTNVYSAPYTLNDDGTINYNGDILTFLSTVPSNSAVAIISINSAKLAEIIRILFGLNVSTNKIYHTIPQPNLGQLVAPTDLGKVAGIRAIDVSSSPPGEESTFNSRYTTYYQQSQSEAPEDLLYAHYGYDAAVIMALGAIKANSIVSEEYKDEVLAITQPGADKTKCNLFKACVELLNQDIDIHYVGAAGSLNLNTNGEPSTHDYNIITYNNQGTY